MKLPILYSFRRCPYAMRARLAIKFARITYEHREILLKSKPEEMLAISPKGTVPVLQLENEIIIDESLNIMYWAFGKSNHEFMNINDEDKLLILENDTSFKKNLDRYKYANRFEDEAQVKKESYEKAIVFLRKLELRLTQHMYLSSNSLSFVDIAIFPFIRQFSKVEEDVWNSNDFNKLKLWLNKIIQLHEFNEVMSKYDVWNKDIKPNIVNA